ncbi:hypothetical protein [Lysinibacillus sp. NPDC093216]|uniref:hypothetical protein n=1 Tax=Lysinibacillus sp. NPDC093216 TaxID=3390576 RepID=UPI003D00013B
MFSFTGSASAAETDSFKESVGGLFVEIPYEENEVYVQNVETNNPNIEQINIYDKETNELISEISVEDEVLYHGLARAASEDSYTSKVVTETTGSGYGKASLKARLNVYSSGTFREIKGVLNTWWEQGSAATYFEQQNGTTIPTSGKWPATKVNISGNATLTAQTTQDMSAGFEKAGFSLSFGFGGNYYARKNVNLSYNYSLY